MESPPPEKGRKKWIRKFHSRNHLNMKLRENNPMISISISISFSKDESISQKFDISQWAKDSDLFIIIGELLRIGYRIELDNYFLQFPNHPDLDKWVKLIHIWGNPINDKRFRYINQYPKTYLKSFIIE